MPRNRPESWCLKMDFYQFSYCLTWHFQFTTRSSTAPSTKALVVEIEMAIKPPLGIYWSRVKSRFDVKTKNVWRRAKNTWLPFSSSLPTVQKLWFATGEISEEKLIFFRSVSSRVPKKCDDFLNTTFERLASSYRLGTEMPTSHNHRITKCRFLFFFKMP